jgi:hypothetical protein
VQNCDAPKKKNKRSFIERTLPRTNLQWLSLYICVLHVQYVVFDLIKDQVAYIINVPESILMDFTVENHVSDYLKLSFLFQILACIRVRSLEIISYDKLGEQVKRFFRAARKATCATVYEISS